VGSDRYRGAVLWSEDVMGCRGERIDNEDIYVYMMGKELEVREE
jgi:hypothetical protein